MNTSTLDASRSVSRGKYQTKNSKSPKSKNVSLSPSPKKIKENGQHLASKMKKTRDKLCNTLDAYVLILQSGAPMRCLQHNSVISLYCQTQQKLLCANCVYRNSNHRLHKVFPVQKCYKHIARDVDQITRYVQRQMSWADDTAKSIGQLFKQEQKNANQSILSLAQIYDQLQIQLSRCFQQSRKKIILSMDSIFSKQESLLLQLQFFKDIFARNKPPEIGLLHDSSASASQNIILFYHQVGNALVQYGKFDGSKMQQVSNRIKNLCKKQFQKASQIRFAIEKWKNQKNQLQKEQKVQKLQKTQPPKQRQITKHIIRN